MTPGEYIKSVAKGYNKATSTTHFTAENIKKFKPLNRLKFLKNYYKWKDKIYSYTKGYVDRENITDRFFDPKKVYLPVEQVENLLFSLTFDDTYGIETINFIKDYKKLLTRLRQITKRYIRIKKKIVAAGAWK